MNSYSESVLMNSINYFIFRQHGKIKDRLFLGYEIDPTALAGGNSSDYSQDFLYQTAIEKLGFMVEINMEINTVKNSACLIISMPNKSTIAV